MKLIHALKNKADLIMFFVNVIMICVFAVIAVVLIQQQQFVLLPFDIMLIIFCMLLANLFWHESRNWQ